MLLKEMKFSDVKLPSNKKFGLFFTFVFALAAAYFYKATNFSLAYTFSLVSLIFLFFTIVKDDLLLPLNKLWMWFGFILGIIVSPIVFGIIFFGLFTPISLIMKLSGRDELRLKFNNKSSHWISRSESIKPENFKQQF
jgi:energy-coupling factor transporter transmembrane protein EcfT